MATLKYKTRGNSNPQGKPKVYFCCHKDDFEKYFDNVSDEILSLQNCSIWYKDSSDHKNEELLEDLKEMQLFIMPVTNKLLCTGNAALEVEFWFAIENHIPVLPLMQEQGLEQIFNQKCGELQFLDKHNTDITVISYEEKLKNYLESVLIGDEMAEKIRAAFDAYVFLSYRKKDRKYAQELMRLIHKNEFCRDIAIWYDEFLTPGENFNESIKEALQKSGLFVLTVTPNLVNEINYIMTNEYPMAKQEGKPILPAELVPTDREELSQKYEDIPTIADAHNDTELSDALFEAIKKMAIKENDKNPEHNFFIGLAYLSGVDVEVNHKKAIELIILAANEGLTEAYKKLISMYRYGIGVKRNPENAISWYEKLVQSKNHEYHTNPNDSTFKSLITDRINFSGFCIELIAYDKAREVLMETIELFEHVHMQKKFQYLFSLCYEKLGTVSEMEGNLDEAEDFYLRFRELVCEKENPTNAMYVSYIRALDHLSEVCTANGNLESAFEFATQAENLVEMMIKYPWAKQRGVRNAIGRTYLNLCHLADLQGDNDRRLEYLAKIQSLLSDSSTTGNAYPTHAEFLAKGAIEYNKDNYPKAKFYLQTALKTALNEYEQKAPSIGLTEICECYRVLISVVIEMEEYTDAEFFCRQAVELSERIHNETPSVNSKLQLAELYHLYGEIFEKTDKLDEANNCYEKAYMIAGDLFEVQTCEAIEMSARCLYKYASIRKDKEGLRTALMVYQQLLELCSDISEYKRMYEVIKKEISEI